MFKLTRTLNVLVTRSVRSEQRTQEITSNRRPWLGKENPRSGCYRSQRDSREALPCDSGLPWGEKSGQEELSHQWNGISFVKGRTSPGPFTWCLSPVDRLDKGTNQKKFST